jgi:aminocarboxymuconate-semialdehyde decarboxylase
VFIGSNVRGKDLDHPDLLPFFAKAEALRAPVFIHPIDVLGGERLRRYYLHNGLGNPFDTAVAGARLIFGGVLDRFPRLTVCLGHAGGAFPYLIGRLDRVHRVRSEAQGEVRRRPTAYLRRLYFDTITHHGLALEYLVSLAGTDRVVLGSDYRFDMGSPDPVGAVRAVRRLSRAGRSALLGGAAAKLLTL